MKPSCELCGGERFMMRWKDKINPEMFGSERETRPSKTPPNVQAQAVPCRACRERREKATAATPKPSRKRAYQGEYPD